MYKNGERTVQKRIKEGLEAEAQSFRCCGETVTTRKHEGLWGKAGGRKNDDFRRNGLSLKKHGVIGKPVWLKWHKTEGIGELPYKKE